MNPLSGAPTLRLEVVESLLSRTDRVLNEVSEYLIKSQTGRLRASEMTFDKLMNSCTHVFGVHIIF